MYRTTNASLGRQPRFQFIQTKIIDHLRKIAIINVARRLYHGYIDLGAKDNQHHRISFPDDITTAALGHTIGLILSKGKHGRRTHGNGWTSGRDPRRERHDRDLGCDAIEKKSAMDLNAVS